MARTVDALPSRRCSKVPDAEAVLFLCLPNESGINQSFIDVRCQEVSPTETPLNNLILFSLVLMPKAVEV